MGWTPVSDDGRRAERYRLAWLSARRGRAAWRRLYLGLVDGAPHDRLGLSFLNLARKHANTIRQLKGELALLQECTECHHGRSWHLWDYLTRVDYCQLCPGSTDQHPFKE